MAKAAYSEFEFGNKNSFQTNLRKARKIAHRLLKKSLVLGKYFRGFAKGI